MPRNVVGQLLTFAIDADEDQRFDHWTWVNVRDGDTIQKIVSRRGHPEDARRVADENNIRSTRSKIHRSRIKVPGELGPAEQIHVLPNGTVRVTAGYANIDKDDRPQRVGLSVFTGFDPITLEVPVRFLSGRRTRQSPADVDRDIQLLERMAGRGNFPGVGLGPPPVIRLSATNGEGEVTPFIPMNYQWSRQNPSAPVWRIGSETSWNDDRIIDHDGHTKSWSAVVVLHQRVRVRLAMRSAASRQKSRKGKKR